MIDPGALQRCDEVHEVQGPFRVALEGSFFKTDGYFVVKDSRRGAIDIDAESRHSTFNGRAELVLSPEASLFVSVGVLQHL